jgi:hypothetical protein
MQSGNSQVLTHIICVFRMIIIKIASYLQTKIIKIASLGILRRQPGAQNLDNSFYSADKRSLCTQLSPASIKQHKRENQF